MANIYRIDGTSALKDSGREGKITRMPRNCSDAPYRNCDVSDVLKGKVNIFKPASKKEFRQVVTVAICSVVVLFGGIIGLSLI